MNSELLEAALRLQQAQDCPTIVDAQNSFIEVLTFSSFNDIVAMLDNVLGQDPLGLPAWARNLAFRLACLLEPRDVAIRRRAAADLSLFLDWPDHVKRLLKEAEQLERGNSA